MAVDSSSWVGCYGLGDGDVSVLAECARKLN